MHEYEAKQAARKAAVEALIATHPHLATAAGTKGGSLQAAAKNIRLELKALYPTVKFSVTSERFSMGDAIRVGWTDGPTSKQVDEVIGKYAAGHFNGMEDIYEHSNSAWTHAFGDAKYVTTSRENSDKAIASALRTLAAKNIDGLEGVDISLEAYRAGGLSQRRCRQPGVDRPLPGLRVLSLDDLRSAIRQCCREGWLQDLKGNMTTDLVKRGTARSEVNPYYTSALPRHPAGRPRMR